MTPTLLHLASNSKTTHGKKPLSCRGITKKTKTTINKNGYKKGA